MDLNKKNVRTLMMLIVFTVLFIGLVNNLPAIGGIIKIIIGLVFPFIVGACLAFVLNVPIHFFEGRVFGKIKFLKKGARGLSLLTTIICLITVISFVVSLVVPEITSTMKIIIAGVPQAANDVVQWIKKLGNDNEQLMTWISEFSIDWKIYLEKFSGMIQTGVQGIFTSAVGFLSGTINVIFDTFVAVVFAIYILFQKEKLTNQGRQVLYAYLPENIVDRVVYILKLAYKTFKNFVTGQCTEAVILGMMFFVAMSIFRLPYALLISVLIAVTALIPIFGAFIGCFVGAFLILFINPMQAVWFVILFLVLQQIEGNLVYPHVVGGSVGLPSIWVLVAVTVGGSLMGVAGMLLFIPLTSVLYALLRESVKNRLHKKNITVEVLAGKAREAQDKLQQQIEYSREATKRKGPKLKNSRVISKLKNTVRKKK